MEIIVPRATKPAGLISRARTYRVVLNPSGLWIIHLGNAMGPPPPNTIIGKLVGIYLKKLAAKLNRQLRTKEKEIASIPLPDLVKLSKHSFHIALQQRCSIRASKLPSLSIKSPQGKITLYGKESDRQAFADIAEMYDPKVE